MEIATFALLVAILALQVVLIVIFRPGIRLDRTAIEHCFYMCDEMEFVVQEMYLPKERCGQAAVDRFRQMEREIEELRNRMDYME